MRVCCLGFVCLALWGCNDQPATVPAASAPNTQPVHLAPIEQGRFQLVGSAYGLALDTKTGLLCHTYNAAVDTYVGGAEGRTVLGHPSLDSAPLCIDLSQREAETITKIQLQAQRTQPQPQLTPQEEQQVQQLLHKYHINQ